MDKGQHEDMEDRIHSGTFRVKSKVPRARFPQRGCGECEENQTYTCRNGSSRNHTNNEGPLVLSPGVQVDTDENKHWQKLLGERVCISGVKQGILRYYGCTNFAQGYYCGVELDEPVGKHDGTVGGYVYFHCKPQHGIFAPVSKVSKLNDLSGSEWQDEIKHQTQTDYNLKHIPDATYSDRRFIKTSRSDPAFMMNTQRVILPSHSFSYDKRNVMEQRQTDPFSDIPEKEAADFEVAGKRKAVSNITTNPLSTCIMSKFGYDRKNHYFGSTVVRLKDDKEPIRKIFAKSDFSSDMPKRSSKSMASRTIQQSSTFPVGKGDYDSFFLKTPPNSGTASPSTEIKRSGAMKLIENYRNLSSSDKVPSLFSSSKDFSDSQEEMLDDDDDQMSMDFEESLGILTPNQMKDFTFCLEGSCSDIQALNFPSSESFDDVNDLPEDEQLHKVSVKYVPESTKATRTCDVSKSISADPFQKAENLSHEQNLCMNSSTDKFLFSISSKDHDDPNSNSHLLSTEVETKMESHDHTILRNFSVISKLKSGGNEFVVKESVSSYIEPEASSSKGLNSTVVPFSGCASDGIYALASVDPASKNLSDNNKIKMIAMQNSNDIDSCLKNYDSGSSRDSLFQSDHEHVASKEKLSVSWEDYVPDGMFAHSERPESVYTVASNDTGYQEDGEYEGDAGMANSVDSSDAIKRFSTNSRDSCIVTEDADGYKIAESNSTSGYSTGLSDSCCNDRHDDDSASCKPLNDESIQDSVGPCDSEDGFSFQDIVTAVKDTDGEVVSDMTETGLFVDSTSDAIYETMVEDTTLTDINELLMSPEEKAEKVASPEEVMEVDHDEVKPETSGTVKEIEILPSQPSYTSTPEKKPNANKAKANARGDPQQRNQRVQAKSKVLDDASNKQIAKSPKRNVMSKIKAMIEATSCKTKKPEVVEAANPKRVVSAPKKSRWDAVTSKIAASLAEEKTKPKVKRDIKSKVDTNLALARQQVIFKASKLDSPGLSSRGDGSMSPTSVSSARDRRSVTEFSSAPGSLKDERENQSRDGRSGQKSPRPGKPGISSRSTSPVAVSESSTTASLSSLNSKNKAAPWKGSASTFASTAVAQVTAPAKKPVTTKPVPIKPSAPSTRPPPPTRLVTKRPPACPKPRAHLSATTGSARLRSMSPSAGLATKAEPSRVPLGSQQPRLAKEQANGRGIHHPCPKPARPPMWLSKAELSQEIQHLGNLCEARTKELNHLKMETKHVTIGFDAFAVLIKYMVEDLNALSVPKLVDDLEKSVKKLEITKQDLAYYEKAVEELKVLHCQELTDLSNKLYEAYQEEVAELNAKHQKELDYLKTDHEKKVDKISISYSSSSEAIKTEHEKLISSLEQELQKQREELEMFHDSEIKDLEEKHEASLKKLRADIEQLQKKCAELKQHSMSMEDAMHKDTDTKLQWVSARKGDLEKEVDSLKAVLEMRNKELHQIRIQNLEMEKQLEDLPLAREKIKMLQARAEDLEALMDAKTKLERKLSTDNQAMRETFEKEAKINKRLSMENEELQWRLRQSEHSILVDTFADDVIEEAENAPISPTKSPAPHAVSRSVFFTFMDKEDMDRNSPQSPGSQYKKINRSFSASYKTSPCRAVNPPPPSSPRKTKNNNEISNASVEGTPKKVPKQPMGRNRMTPKRSHSVGENSQMEQSTELIMDSNAGESIASSMSSESSVFEHKNRLLEENKEQIIATLEVLREQRSAEDAMYSPTTPGDDAEKKWCSDGSQLASNADVMSQSDPKTYYHMTFAVLKDSGGEGGTEDNSRKTSSENSPDKEQSDSLQHSMPKSDAPIDVIVEEAADKRDSQEGDSAVTSEEQDGAHDRWRTV